MTRIATTARHVVPAESPGLTFAERYAVVSLQFPGWLVDEPIRFPRLHPTFGWACRVNGCNAVVHDADRRLLCVGHANLYNRRTDDAGLEEFAIAAEPFKALSIGWGLVRRAGCRICGDNREAQQHQYCTFHASKLRRARRSPLDESDWASAQSAGDILPPCALPGCVHDGELSAAVGADRHRLCRGHRQSWRSHRQTLTGAPTLDDWSRWTAKRSVLESVTSPDARGHLTTAHLPPPLRQVIRYALHRYANTASRTQWRPAALQTVVDALAEHDVESFDDPVVAMLTERSGRWSAERRIWLDLVPVVRAATVTPESARAAGWFDPAIVGAGPFPGSQGQENRRKEWNLAAVTQPWLRDLLWDYLHDEALQPVGRKASSATIFNRIVGIALLSRILRHIRADRGEDPRQLTNADARAVKEMWDLWFREQIPVPRRVDASEDDWAPLNHRNRHVYMSNMRIVLRHSREHRRTPPSMDSFILGLPQYPRPHESPRPRPLTYADFQLLVSADSVATLSDMDDDDVGLADIWLTQAFQGGRISETLKLRLGCVGLIGAAQPYIWRDISKVDLIDYGMPCYLPVYERLIRRQDKTRRKLRARYADVLATLDVRERSQLEARWDRSMPLFPRSYTNPDLLIEVTQPGFRRTWTAWFETLGLQGLTTHQTRATLATSLLNNGAPAALVRQLLGHFSSESLAHYANYNNDTMTKHLQKVWAAGPGMDKPGTILLRPTDVGNAEPAAAAARIDLTIVPVEHGLCRYGPVVGGGNCPFGKNCSRGPHGACEHFVLTGADLAYWERKRDAAYHFAEGAPTDDARDYILGEWQPWETVLGSLRAELDDLGLLEEAQNLDLRAPVRDYFEPIFATGWPVSHLYRTDDDNEAPDDTSTD
ncbi:tyrosine-type recombinase/integrase [Rhodococcus koreensis]